MISSKENSFNIYGALHILLLAMVVGSFATATFAQKTRAVGGRMLVTKEQPAVVTNQLQPEAGDNPTTTINSDSSTLPDNATCDDLVGRSGFLNVTTDATVGSVPQLKYGASDSNYNFVNQVFPIKDNPSNPLGPVDTIPDNSAPYNTKSVTLTVSQGAGNHTASFNSQVPVTAMIFKLGNTSYAFAYNIGALGYSTMGMASAIQQQGFSHIILCFGRPLSTTAAEVSVSGRVLTAGGRAVSGARVTILNAGTGQMLYAMTNPFGYYTVEGLDSDSFYVATIAKKGVKFAEDTKSFSLNDNIADLDFVANP